MSKRKRRSVSYKDWITEDGLSKLQGWARDGLINEQIAHNMGVAEGTLYRWMKEHSEIDEVLKQNKDIVDRQVENAMHMSAVGFRYTEEMVANTGEVVEVIKYSKPNTTAQIFWLKNRKHEWTDRQELDITLPTFIDDVDE